MINKAGLRLYEVTDLSTFIYVAEADECDARLTAEDYAGKRLDHLAVVSESDCQGVNAWNKPLSERFQEMLKPGVVYIIRKQFH